MSGGASYTILECFPDPPAPSTTSDPLPSNSAGGPRSPSSSPAIDYLQLGSSFCDKQLYQLAEQAYSRGLATSPPPEDHLRLTLLFLRAATRLELQAFKPAYRDAVESLELVEASGPPEDDVLNASEGLKRRGLMLRAQAEEGLRLYSVSLASYNEVLSLHSTHQKAGEGRSRTSQRLEEAEQGNYDWAERFQLALDVHTCPRQDAADILGPWKVDRISGRGGGRGAVATRDIKPGELLLVEKAFAIVYPWEVEDGDIDGETVRRVVRKLQEDGSLARGMMSLYAGPAYPPPMSTPAGLSFTTKLTSNVSATLDPGRVHGICGYNWCALLTLITSDSS